MIMTSSNLLKLNLNQDSGNDILNIKSKTTQSSPGTSFKSVLDNTVNNYSKRNETAANNNVGQDNDSKTKFKSFAEVQLSKKSVSTKSVVQADSNKELANVSTDEAQASEKYDDQILALAQMLGIAPGQLVDLAKQLGFSLKDLKNVDKLTVFMQKVSDLLELNDKQKDILLKLATEVTKQIKPESVAVTENSNNIPASEDINPQAGKVSIDLSKVALSVKEKLDTLIENGQNNPGLISDEAAKIIAVMKSQSQSVETAVSQNIDTDVVEEVSLEGDSKKADSDKVHTETKSKDVPKEDNDESTESTKPQLGLQGLNTSAETATTDEQNLTQNFQAVGDVKTVLNNNQIAAEKSVFSVRQPIKTSDVVNQVMEQAKVILGQDKTEMIIQLKPDHLGKLELKVVTEQGIVAAKFIAESQQVKEIIETNMQLLKDSLQKQGIAIDGVSVQVGQENRSENRNQSLTQGKNNGSGNGMKHAEGVTGSTVAGVSLLENLPERLAQYTDDLNTINLTA
ncbi:flagellar hook-length control protein FliK [Clostridium sp. BNL1100]|uniref:flagellar hook-length control protein FliK n=1 Tax=Clostridium sp. BNL1100 TaxID=755731 RepID=UPI00024A7963|nr:flagellar hook-length control protein FliK [Clostridium sp. BNL1100]AEY66577.1 flagellar hook-length control protein [Clostridium sp. BNL1100]